MSALQSLFGAQRLVQVCCFSAATTHDAQASVTAPSPEPQMVAPQEPLQGPVPQS